MNTPQEHYEHHRQHHAPFPRLLADVGGTNIRFGSQSTPTASIHHIRSYACADFETLSDAIVLYLRREALAEPRACAIGIATPVTGDRVSMTNHHWSFSIAALKRSLGLRDLLVLNDFSALAQSLPVLPPNALTQIGGGQAVAGCPLGLVGPGTGLGVAGLVPGTCEGEMLPVAGEGGHATLASQLAEEQGVLACLHRKFGHVSAERALSGPGLVNLYEAVAQLHGVAPVVVRSAAEIVHDAMQGRDPSCVRALDMFCGLLGDVCGNVALTLGARGGMYVGGGIVPRLGDWFAHSSFRARFESRGRFTGYLQAIPTWVLRSGADAALLGANRALDLQARSMAKTGSTGLAEGVRQAMPGIVRAV